MAKMTNKVTFQKGIIFEENGEFFIEEIKKDSSETYNLSEYIRKFVTSEGETPRLVDTSINEVFEVQGTEE